VLDWQVSNPAVSSFKQLLFAISSKYSTFFLCCVATPPPLSPWPGTFVLPDQNEDFPLLVRDCTPYLPRLLLQCCAQTVNLFYGILPSVLVWGFFFFTKPPSPTKRPADLTSCPHLSSFALFCFFFFGLRPLLKQF